MFLVLLFPKARLSKFPDLDWEVLTSQISGLKKKKKKKVC